MTYRWVPIAKKDKRDSGGQPIAVTSVAACHQWLAPMPATVTGAYPWDCKRVGGLPDFTNEGGCRSLHRRLPHVCPPYHARHQGGGGGGGGAADGAEALEPGSESQGGAAVRAAGAGAGAWQQARWRVRANVGGCHSRLLTPPWTTAAWAAPVPQMGSGVGDFGERSPRFCGRERGPVARNLARGTQYHQISPWRVHQPQ